MVRLSDHDEHVKEVGVDVGAMSADQMAAAGIRVRSLLYPVDGTAWMTHEVFARRNPDVEEKRRDYARLSAYLHYERQYQKVWCPTCRKGEGLPCIQVGPDRGGPQAQAQHSHAARRAAARDEGHVSLRGLVLEQSFPCPGTFRQVDRSGKVVLVQCDACGQELGVAPPKPGAKEEEDQRPLGEDDIPL